MMLMIFNVYKGDDGVYEGGWWCRWWCMLHMLKVVKLILEMAPLLCPVPSQNIIIINISTIIWGLWRKVKLSQSAVETRITCEIFICLLSRVFPVESGVRASLILLWAVLPLSVIVYLVLSCLEFHFITLWSVSFSLPSSSSSSLSLSLHSSSSPGLFEANQTQIVITLAYEYHSASETPKIIIWGLKIHSGEKSNMNITAHQQHVKSHQWPSWIRYESLAKLALCGEYLVGGLGLGEQYPP